MSRLGYPICAISALLIFMLVFSSYKIKLGQNLTNSSNNTVAVVPVSLLMQDKTPSKKLKTSFRRPFCENLVKNLTAGKWIRKVDLNINLFDRFALLQEEKGLWKALNSYWRKRGIQKSLWRSDGKCGYEIKQEQPPRSSRPLVGTWCDKDGPRPCCNNIHSGTCSPISDKNCSCPECFDMRTVVLAEVSKWITEDPRCMWHYYFGDEICDVISASVYDDITFIGESVLRNMYDALLNLLTEDIVYGSLKNNLTPKQIELCVGPERYYWKDCRFPPLNISNLFKGLTICKKYDKVPFALSASTLHYPEILTHRVKQLLGKKGSLILFGVGIHVFCDATQLINQFLKPVCYLFHQHYKTKSRTTEKWPKIMIVSTPSEGLLKPPEFLEVQGRKKCQAFNTDVKKFCDENDMLYLDIMPFTFNAFSYDGTHHAFAVNAMKVQLFLNNLAQNR